MTDLEGVAGVLDVNNWLTPEGRYYETAKKLLTGEVNAAIEGFSSKGFTEFVVNDGHGEGAIDIELLDNRAKLAYGCGSSDKDTSCWPLGIDESFDAAAVIGQHAKSGTSKAHLPHTQWWHYLDIAINGLSVGEFGQFALVAGEYNVPTIFASGDKAFCLEAEKLCSGIITATVKEGVVDGSGDSLITEQYMLSHQGAMHLHSQKAQDLIYKGAQEATRNYIKKRDSCKPLKMDGPYRVICKFRPFRDMSAMIIEVKGKDSIADVFNGIRVRELELYHETKKQ